MDDKIAQAIRPICEKLVSTAPLREPAGVADGETLDIADVGTDGKGSVEVAFAEDVTAIPVEERADVVTGGVGVPMLIELWELEGGGVIGIGAVTVVSVDGPLAVLVGVSEEDVLEAELVGEDENDPPTMEILGLILASSPRTE